MAKQSDFTIQFGCLVAYRGADSDVVIPDGVTTIGSQAFDERLVSVTLPASVTTVEQTAFGNCRNLEKITILGTIQQAGVNAFGFFYGKPDLELSVYSAVPIRAFTKAAQETVIHAFVRRINEFDPKSEVFRDNLRFLGAHLKQAQKAGGPFWNNLVRSEAFRRVLLAADAIPAKDLKWLIPALQEVGHPDVTAELLDYQNRLLSDQKVRKSLEKSEARAEQKALSAEMTVADWRKQLKFGYEGDGVVIKGVKHQDPVITIPDHIGSKPVRVIDRMAFECTRYGGRRSPEQIILPEGITEIRRGAFLYVENAEIIFPSTLKTLPEGCFVAVRGLMLHLPMSIESLPEELEWDSVDPFKAICAPSGSFAEQYAKEHGIPFEAE